MKRYLLLACFLPTILGVNCPPPVRTDGLDLSKRGDLHISITRALSRSSSDVTAYVLDNGAGLFVLQLLELSSTQVIQVDGVRLTHQLFDIPSWVSGTIPAKAPPGNYMLAFNDNGVVQTMQAGAVDEIAIALPLAGSTVSKSGFALTWTPSGDADVRVKVELEGDVADPDSAGGIRQSTASIENKPDSGSLAVPAHELAKFLPGTLRATVARQRRVPQALGFHSGEVTVQTTDEREFMLTY